jgi:hypothetical protein
MLPFAAGYAVGLLIVGAVGTWMRAVREVVRAPAATPKRYGMLLVASLVNSGTWTLIAIAFLVCVTWPGAWAPAPVLGGVMPLLALAGGIALRRRSLRAPAAPVDHSRSRSDGTSR